MGVFKKRKKRLKIRRIKETMEYANKECKKELDKLNNSRVICSCPECKSNEHVKPVGSNRGMRKFVCSNPEHDKSAYFSTSTSYEAIEIYRETMAKNLCLLAHTNSNLKGVTLYNQTSKYFVEYGLEALYEFISQEVNKPIIKIDKNSDIVTIFFDLSGSKLAKNKAIILAKIGGKTMFELMTHTNYLNAHSLVSTLKERLNLSNETQIVFITDGEACYVDPIRDYFPNSIHIRQFHALRCKGIIYVHLKYENQTYTIRCRWDAVLDEGTPPKEVIKQRELKAKKRTSQKETKKTVRYSELSDDIMIWKGTVYMPRGFRRKLGGKIKKPKKLRYEKKTSKYDSSELLFKGKPENAKKLGVVKVCFQILKKVFGGLYITSNIVETIFNIKTKLASHRTMKFGERILVCLLYCHIHLRSLKKEELITFLKEKIITYDFIMSNVLHGSGLQKNKIEEPSFLEILKEAIEKKVKVMIHYCDRYHKHTSRIIKPTNILKSEYDNTTKIEAYCELRNDTRTFYLERIRDATIYDPKPIII